MWGRDPLLPMDGNIPLPSSSLNADAIISRLNTAFKNAASNLEKKQEKQKADFDKNVMTDQQFRVGDVVMYEKEIRHVGEPDKLQPKRLGPYKVIAKLSENSYLIRFLDNPAKVPEKVSVRKLIKYLGASETEEIEKLTSQVIESRDKEKAASTKVTNPKVIPVKVAKKKKVAEKRPEKPLPPQVQGERKSARLLAREAVRVNFLGCKNQYLKSVNPCKASSKGVGFCCLYCIWPKGA
jgi:hypothetical protein